MTNHNAYGMDVYVVVDTTAVNCNAKTHPAGWHGMHAIVGVAHTQAAANAMVTAHLANCPWVAAGAVVINNFTVGII